MARTAKTLAPALKTKIGRARNPLKNVVAAIHEEAEAKAARKPAKAKTTPKAKPAPIAKDSPEELITAFVSANGGKTNAKGNTTLVCETNAGETITFDSGALSAKLQKLAMVGGQAMLVRAALADAKAKPVLARGVESRTNPHCSKAIADSKPTAAAKPDKATTAKPAKASKTKADTTMPFTVLVHADDSGVRAGTDRYERLLAVSKAKTLGEALACQTASGKAIAMDNIRGMEKRGHVKLG